jgi:hypothetical protein
MYDYEGTEAKLRAVLLRELEALEAADRLERIEPEALAELLAVAVISAARAEEAESRRRVEALAVEQYMRQTLEPRTAPLLREKLPPLPSRFRLDAGWEERAEPDYGDELRAAGRLRPGPLTPERLEELERGDNPWTRFKMVLCGRGNGKAARQAAVQRVADSVRAEMERSRGRVDLGSPSKDTVRVTGFVDLGDGLEEVAFDAPRDIVGTMGEAHFSIDTSQVTP